MTKIETDQEVAEVTQAFSGLALGRTFLLAKSLFRQNGGDAVELLPGSAKAGARSAVSLQAHAYQGISAETIRGFNAIQADQFFSLMDRIPETLYQSERLGLVEKRARALHESKLLPGPGPRQVLES